MTPKGDVMAIVLLDMVTTLDGFIAGPDDEPGGSTTGSFRLPVA
jgi:hypothetical protein